MSRSAASVRTTNPAVMSEVMRYYPVPEIRRFGEAALRATVKRDLAWLLNTTQFGARGELEGYPEVQASVLNFGVPDLAGRTLHARTVLDRARQIRNAIRVFETRIDAESLVVEPLASSDKPNTVVFLIRAVISSGVRPVPVQLYRARSRHGGGGSVGLDGSAPPQHLQRRTRLSARRGPRIRRGA